MTYTPTIQCQCCKVYHTIIQQIPQQLFSDQIAKHVNLLQQKIKQLESLLSRPIIFQKSSQILNQEIQSTVLQNQILRQKISSLDNEILCTQQNIQQLDLDEAIQKHYQHKTSELQKLQLSRLKKILANQKPINSSQTVDGLKNISQSTSFEFQKLLKEGKNKKIKVQDVNFDIDF
eukprot:EST45739.1 Hypothetical protein SS50377_14311 [Spironucleus salmonicida]